MKLNKILILLTVLATNANAQSCPNGDFENWTSHSYTIPDSGWYNSNLQSISMDDSLTVWAVAGISGQAVHIQTAIIGTDTLQAYVLNSQGDPKIGQGGVPYSQQPTSITGYYRYNLQGNDSALMLVMFKRSGIIIAANTFMIRNSTGSLASFTAFSLPLSTLPTAPDSVIIAFASSNLNSGNGIQSGSWIEIDQLEFAGTGITQPIVGGSFDNFINQVSDKATGWKAQNSNSNSAVSGINKATSHYSGNYSVQLTTLGVSGSGSTAFITSGYLSQYYGPKGGLPYSNTSDTLTGYYKYTTTGAGLDTGRLHLSLTVAGVNVGGNNYYFLPSPTWTYFEMPFSAGTTPDTIRIDLLSSDWNTAVPGSVLSIDYLQLKSQPLPPVGINNIVAPNYEISVFPNPVNDILNIMVGNASGKIEVRVYDMIGSAFDRKSYDVAPTVITLSVGYLPTGLYFYEVRNNGTITNGKFLKQ